MINLSIKLYVKYIERDKNVPYRMHITVSAATSQDIAAA